MQSPPPEQANPQQMAAAMVAAQGHEQSGRPDLAERIYRDLISTQPQFHPAYQGLGLLAFGAGKLVVAADLFQSAIALDGTVALYQRNLGEICRRLGRFADAVEAGQQACRLTPFDTDAHFNLALAFTDARRREEAENAYWRVLALQEPLLQQGRGTAALWNQRGMAQHRLQRLDDARASYLRALEMAPSFVMARNSLGCVLREMGLADESHAQFAQAVQQGPAFADARLNLGMAQLRSGDWENGWENYEARWTGSAESNNGTFGRPYCPLPQWGGTDDLPSQSLLIFAEQGFGDLFQFARYVNLAAERFCRVALVCPHAVTHILMERSFGDRVLLLKQMPADFSSWDWQCPMMSLPRAFGTRPTTVPGGAPYLKVAPLARDYWRSRLAQAAPQCFTIGVSWQGSRTHQFDRQRSLTPALLQQLLSLHDMAPGRKIAWVCLQKQEAGDAYPVIPKQATWLDWSAELCDFADTAALVANLDLVISIDSATAHLAGALAQPVWLLNRFDSEWRWGVQRSDSPWYPGMRIFNQRHLGDWAGVIADVHSALQAGLLHGERERQ